MVHLTEFFNIVPPKIVGGDEYNLNCYGEQARYLDLEKNVCIVFDERLDATIFQKRCGNFVQL